MFMTKNAKCFSKNFMLYFQRDEIEWFGLNIFEARLKQTLIEEKQNEQIPLKSLFRKQYIEFLKQEELEKANKPPEEEKSTGISK